MGTTSMTNPVTVFRWTWTRSVTSVHPRPPRGVSPSSCSRGSLQEEVLAREGPPRYSPYRTPTFDPCRRSAGTLTSKQVSPRIHSTQARTRWWFARPTTSQATPIVASRPWTSSPSDGMALALSNSASGPNYRNTARKKERYFPRHFLVDPVRPVHTEPASLHALPRGPSGCQLHYDPDPNVLAIKPRST